MKKTILIILAPGFEESEAVIPIDLLRRAEIDVTLASLEDNLLVRSYHNVLVTADTPFKDVTKKNFDALFLPGGPGTKHLKESDSVIKMLQQFHREGKLICAICAAPIVLKKAGLLNDKKYTAHFSVKDELPDIQPAPVIKDGTIITSQGAGTTIPFGLAIIEALTDKSTADRIAKDICYK